MNCTEPLIRQAPRQNCGAAVLPNLYLAAARVKDGAPEPLGRRLDHFP